MKTVLLAAALVLPLHALPSDEDLLKLAKEKTGMECLTPVPVDMAAKVALLCGEPGLRSPKEGPHEGARLLIHASADAVLRVFDPWGKFPEGSVILKEKLARGSDSTQLFTGMLKREKGYFPEGGDWEYFTVDAKATQITGRGRLMQCASCHEDYPESDFVTKVYAAPLQISGGRIVLHSSRAQVQGEKLQYERAEAKNTLGFWVNPQDWASWHFKVVKPGTYSIHVWQGCGKGSGGSEVEIKCAGQNARFTVEDTGHFQNFKERVVGKLSFDKPGPQALEVRALSKPGAAVMDLRQVILVPER